MLSKILQIPMSQTIYFNNISQVLQNFSKSMDKIPRHSYVHS